MAHGTKTDNRAVSWETALYTVDPPTRIWQLRGLSRPTTNTQGGPTSLPPPFVINSSPAEPPSPRRAIAESLEPVDQRIGGYSPPQEVVAVGDDEELHGRLIGALV